MGFIIALDVGDKRVGVAICEEGAPIASPMATYERAKNEAEQKILKLIQDKQVGKLIVGLPLGADGSRNKQCDKIENFCRRIKARVAVELIYIDEYGSSKEAEHCLTRSGGDLRSRRKKGMIDALSASIILQTYLDNTSCHQQE